MFACPPRASSFFLVPALPLGIMHMPSRIPTIGKLIMHHRFVRAFVEMVLGNYKCKSCMTNTRALRYLSKLAGAFIFVTRQKMNIQLTPQYTSRVACPDKAVPCKQIEENRYFLHFLYRAIAHCCKVLRPTSLHF